MIDENLLFEDLIYCKELGRRSLEAVINVINKQPKVEWIPCSERLPEEDGEYLVWVRYEGREFTTTEEYEDGIWNYSGTYNFNDKVIAWMPLPEPYRE